MVPAIIAAIALLGLRPLWGQKGAVVLQMGSAITDKHMQADGSQGPQKSVQIAGSRVKDPQPSRQS